MTNVSIKSDKINEEKLDQLFLIILKTTLYLNLKRIKIVTNTRHSTLQHEIDIK